MLKSWAVGLTMFGCSLAMAQSNRASESSPVRQSLEKKLAGLEKQLLGIAEAMPAEHYSFAPTNGSFRGVRNFAKQLKHAAAVHYLIGAAILEETPPAAAADERGPDAVKTKAEVIQYMKDSFVYLRKAVATIDAKNLAEPIKGAFGSGPETRLGLVISAIGHSSNHYGQAVEYLRMNGVIPPPSE